MFNDIFNGTISNDQVYRQMIRHFTYPPERGKFRTFSRKSCCYKIFNCALVVIIGE